MKVLLKCKCTDGEVGLDVRDRNEGEHILDYMNHVQGEVGHWHQFRQCSETKLEYLKMPLTEDKPIGVSK